MSAFPASQTIIRSAGEVIGFYAGLVRLKAGYDAARGFWDNVRRFHRRLQPLFTGKSLFGDLLLIIKPGAAFPLAIVNLVLGAVTCAGKLSLIVECAEENVDARMMAAIRDSAVAFLLGNW